MSANDWALVLLWASAPPVTVYVLLLAVTTPWWRSWTGWAMFTFAAGYAMLVDVSLAFRVLGANYPGRATVILIAFSVTTVGVWLKCLDLVTEKVRAIRHLDREP